MDKPEYLFDRDAEWANLTAFVGDRSEGATLGVLSGRRRQGKSFLLQALCRETGGFYFAASEATEVESLRQLGDSYAAHRGLGSSVPVRFANWDQAVDALLDLGRQGPVPVVIDEFPYLATASPALPSVLQRALGPLRPERVGSQARLILCGSSMSFMGRLLSGSAPLRGRAGLELIVSPLDYRMAARFWEITDPRLAVRVHSIVGGTPAYRREFVRSDAPRDLKDFDDWVCRTVLAPAMPLFREARYLLAEEPGIRDTALYSSVLAAVAEGNHTRGGIAGYVGRNSADLGHPLDVLEDAGLLARDRDLLRKGRSTYRVAEPLITFYHAVMRPDWATLEGAMMAPERTSAVWRAAQGRFVSNVLGPHFEQMCRTWAARFAPPATFIADPSIAAVDVGAATVSDAAARTSHEVDVLVTATRHGRRRKVLSIGEAKWGARMGLAHYERLLRIRALLAGHPDLDLTDANPACYSAVGFTDDLRRLADQGQVLLVDLHRMYG